MSSSPEPLKVYELSNGRKRYAIYWEDAYKYRLYEIAGDVTKRLEKTYYSRDEALRALKELLDAS